ncbi:hypothetical protein AF72_11175 [Xylella taiwanensis]|uniref:Uncharacterized protein n=1 Tax=Xylella taiwanensis TaxID=1444770 RepID=Z9JG86_9GAMM|nr:hypothetical protein [Xylella taiwanensis]EWS77410.1 hypothetical protein AF72_11175 [Xylella taiwanensis]UFS50491.1 hypothetical protein LPH54_05120 [Xylella taiwanensis]
MTLLILLVVVYEESLMAVGCKPIRCDSIVYCHYGINRGDGGNAMMLRRV